MYRSARELPAPAREGDFSIVCPLGVEPRSLALAARTALVIGRNTAVVQGNAERANPRYAFVSSAGRAVIGPGAGVGPVYAMGDSPPVIENGATIHGYIKSVSPFQPPAGARIELGALDRVNGSVESFSWSVPFPATTAGDCASGAGGRNIIHLRPGGYGHLVVGRDSRIVLHSGTYYVDTLEVDPTGILEIDNADEAVYVWVRSGLSLGGSVRECYLHANVLLGFLGADPVTVIGPFRGTLVAPAANVTLQRTEAPHSGAFFADTLTVADGAVVEHRGFTPRPTQVRPASAVCKRCDEEATASEGDCCSAPDGSSRECAEKAERVYEACEARFEYATETCEELGHRRTHGGAVCSAGASLPR